MNKRKLVILTVVFLAGIGLCSILQPGTYSANEKNGPEMNGIIFDDWGASFALPSSKWTFIGEQYNEKMETSVFSYRREGIVDKSREKVLANISFIFEKVPKNMNLATYSTISLKRGVPLKIKSKFTAVDGLMSLKNAIGYVATFYDPYKKEHTIVLVHAISSGKGMQVIMDITTELAPQVSKEFDYVLKSITFK